MLMDISVAAGSRRNRARLPDVRRQARHGRFAGRSLQGASITWSTTSISWMRSTTPPWSSRWSAARASCSGRAWTPGLIDGIVNGVGARCRRCGRRAAPAAIRQYPQLRHLGAVRLGGPDRGHGPRREVCPDEPPDPGPRHCRWPGSWSRSRFRARRPRRAAACGRWSVRSPPSSPRSACSPGSTAAPRASSSLIDVPWIATPEHSLRDLGERRQPLAGPALHLPHADLRADLLELHSRTASRSSTPSCCCWNSA